MRLPRDIGGLDLSRRLAVYGYAVTRQTGGHVKLASNHTGRENQLTIATAKLLHMATLNNILVDVAAYLAIDKDVLAATIFA